MPNAIAIEPDDGVSVSSTTESDHSGAIVICPCIPWFCLKPVCQDEPADDAAISLITGDGHDDAMVIIL